jgi:DNA-binding NtrC family response regulator
MHDPTYKLADPSPPVRVRRNHASLLFSWGEALGALALREGQSVIVGRAEPATFIIDDRSLSRAHARVALCDGQVTLEDLSSTNGCSLNGARVQCAVLNEGDVAQCGSVELRVAARSAATAPAEAELSHAHFMHQLAEEIRRARLFGRPLAVIALRDVELGAEHRTIQLPPRPFYRTCRFAPALVLVLLIETDAPAANAWVDELQRGSQRPWAIGMVCEQMFAYAPEELVSRALDAAHAVKPGMTALASLAPRERSDVPLTLSPALRQLYDLVSRAARTTMTVLVLGETGSGKELVARALHERSPRAKGPFRVVNCGAIPSNLVESTLFGHERGAFTGADRQTRGIFEEAHGGTIFLDEIAELSFTAQPALLRVLEQRRITRVGGTREIEIDVRVIAATHRDLPAMVACGAFREDLLFRLDTMCLRVPPLRERREEIVPLAELFMRRASSEWGTRADRLSEEAVNALIAYAWPGNVRQLKNVIESAAAMATTNVVELDDLPEHVSSDLVQGSAGSAVVSPRAGSASLPALVREFESKLVREALAKAGGNQAQAARILGVPRRTLANKVHCYGLLDPSEGRRDP